MYADTRISENAIRRQFNLPVRTFYTFQDDHLLIKSLDQTIDIGLPKGILVLLGDAADGGIDGRTPGADRKPEER